MDETLRRIQGGFSAMSLTQRLVLAAVGVAIVASLVAFSLWLRKPDYAVLFSDLDMTNAGEIAQELEQKGERYQVARGGTTILVPADRVAELRIGLASSGLIQPGGVGYEIFDSNEIGVSDFVQQINLKRALEGELARTIASLTAVEKARVHIVLPKESIFKQNQREATASVVLSLKRGNALSQAQIGGIANLVAYSVEGLSPEKVTIIDQRGTVLSSPQEDTVAGLSNSQLEVKKRLEDYLAGKAEDLLMAALGPGRAVVRVNAELDFRDIEVTKTTYDPNTVVRSEQTAAESNTQEGSKNETATTNYDINQTIERIVGGGGGITSLSVAVFVDKRPAAGDAGGAGEFAPLTAEEIKQLEDIVKGAVGFDPTRNDIIKVVNMPLASVEGESVETKEPVTTWLPGLLSKVVAAGILVFLFLVFRKQLQRVFSEDRAYPAYAAAMPAQRRKGAELGAMEASLEERTRELSMNDPDQVVKLVKTWLAE